MGRLVRYTLAHGDGLTRCVAIPEVPLDHKGAEQEFQHPATLQHASLFAGIIRGTERWATLLGVVRTAKEAELTSRPT